MLCFFLHFFFLGVPAQHAYFFLILFLFLTSRTDQTMDCSAVKLDSSLLLLGLATWAQSNHSPPAT